MEEQGKRVEERGNRYEDSEFIEALREEEPAGTSDVAESVGCTRQAAHLRLNDLHDAGEVEKQMIGASLIWSLSEN